MVTLYDSSAFDHMNQVLLPGDQHYRVSATRAS
jgi:hypothetical protein